MKTIFILFILTHASVFGQRTKQDSLWIPLAPLIGSWEGQGGGAPGTGNYQRTYRFIFGKRFIEVRNTSVYPPTEKNKNGEVHEDIGYISFDKARKKFVLRQFHTEGFVNQYTLDSMKSDRGVLFFNSESIENIPAGWRARETYQIMSNDEFKETFELSAPNAPFEVYTEVTLRRKQ